jgi:hypothetical protein
MFGKWTFCILDILYPGRFVTGRLVTGCFITGRYVTGRFVGVPSGEVHTVQILLSAVHAGFNLITGNDAMVKGGGHPVLYRVGEH